MADYFFTGDWLFGLHLYRDIYPAGDGTITVRHRCNFNPTGKIKKLKSNLVFRDTFDNRLALADAYLEAGEFESAIELYEKSLVDTFADHGYGNMQLLIAYAGKKRFEDVIAIAKKNLQIAAIFTFEVAHAVCHITRVYW